jgi:mono/diheme cytochrome c family protein
MQPQNTTHYPRFLLMLAMLMLAFVVGACGGDGGSSGFDTLPTGDAERGEAIFGNVVNNAPACTACHALTDQGMAGPGLAGYSSIAGERVEGQSAEVYTYNAIVYPSRHIVEGYSNVMYTGYGRDYNEQQLADLIAYLLSL